MKITEEHIKACQLLVQRKEWEYVESILREFLNGLKDITTLDENEKKEDKNIVLLARIKAYETLDNFLKTLKILSQRRDELNEKDSFE